MKTEFCTTHNQEESAVDPFKVCECCKHVFPTEQILVSAYNRIRGVARKNLMDSGHHTTGREMGLSFRGKDVRYCPFCLQTWIGY